MTRKYGCDLDHPVEDSVLLPFDDPAVVGGRAQSESLLLRSIPKQEQLSILLEESLHSGGRLLTVLRPLTDFPDAKGEVFLCGVMWPRMYLEPIA